MSNLKMKIGLKMCDDYDVRLNILNKIVSFQDTCVWPFLLQSYFQLIHLSTIIFFRNELHITPHDLFNRILYRVMDIKIFLINSKRLSIRKKNNNNKKETSIFIQLKRERERERRIETIET